MEFPLGVVHFVGGQGVGVFPKNAYGTLLEALVDAGELLFVVLYVPETLICFWMLVVCLMRRARGLSAVEVISPCKACGVCIASGHEQLVVVCGR